MKRSQLDEAGRAAVRRVLEHATFEMIPLKNALDQSHFLPPGATVSVTASPTKTLEDTWDLAAELQQRGFDVVPHLSARMTHDRAHLEKLLQRLEELEISKVFLVGGDAQDPGEFFDAPALLEAMVSIGHHLTSIGITAYPDGHAVISNDALDIALAVKRPHARYMTTQMCFDPRAIGRFITRVRRQGIDLPVQLGIPGVADRLKLMSISARIGVGQSVRFVSKNRGLIRRFMTPGRYTPDELLDRLGPVVTNEAAAVEGVHIYTFNQCETTERWRQEYLERLA